MAKGNDVYVKLSEKIGVVGYPRYVAILENMMTPEEAGLAVDLAEGKTPAQLTKKLKIDEKSLSAKIESLVSRRFVMRGKEGGYTIPRMPRFFPRIANTPKLKELWFDFFHSGDYPEIDVDAMKGRIESTGKRGHKIIPAKQALLASPNLKKKDILWYEDMEQIFKRAKRVVQGGLKEDGSLGKREESGCGCRVYWGNCEAVGGCTSWEWQPGEWGADTPLGLPFGDPDKFREEARKMGFISKIVSVEEALDACYKMEDAMQVHISPNTAQITSTCNCCECCCEIFYGFKHYANIYRMLSPSRFRAIVDKELCKGCQTCIERCQFDAIKMMRVPGSKKMKAYIVEKHCMGCGLCIYKCPNNAMRFEIIRPPEHIPTTPFGRG